jgi:hypothetical protein
MPVYRYAVCAKRLCLNAKWTSVTHYEITNYGSCYVYIHPTFISTVTAISSLSDNSHYWMRRSFGRDISTSNASINILNPLTSGAGKYCKTDYSKRYLKTPQTKSSRCWRLFGYLQLIIRPLWKQRPPRYDISLLCPIRSKMNPGIT